MLPGGLLSPSPSSRLDMHAETIVEAPFFMLAPHNARKVLPPAFLAGSIPLQLLAIPLNVLVASHHARQGLRCPHLPSQGRPEFARRLKACLFQFANLVQP